jgi:protease I
MANLHPRLSGKRIAILAAEGVHEHEFWVPYYRLKEEGAELIVCGFEQGAVYKGEGRHGKDGIDLAPTDTTFQKIEADSLDALIIPGGIYGPMLLRMHKPALDLVRKMNSKKKIIAAICHGQWVLISANILDGRKVTSTDDIAVDLKNAGAEWIHEDVVQDGNIITGVYYGILPKFMRFIIEAVETGY